MTTASQTLARIPGPASLVRTLPAALRDPLAFLLEMQARYGDVVMLREQKAFLVVHPEGLKRVLQDNHPNYTKGPRYRDAIRRLMGDGLLTAEGAAWRMQRRLAQPAFLRKQHELFAAIVAEEATTLRRRWLQYAASGEVFELHRELAQSLLVVIQRLIFGDDLAGRSDQVAAAFQAAEHELNIVRAFLPFHLPDWFPTPSNLRLRKALRVLDGFILDTIRSRRKDSAAGRDLLSMYLSARDEETGAALSDELVRDEMMTLMSAGHDTTSDSICWAFYLLLTHPPVYERVRAEAGAAFGGGLPAHPETLSLPVTTMVFQEALRLYPPIWGFLRTALKPDVICGYDIPAGARLVLAPYVMHRHPGIWERPESFEPERFLPENSSGRHRFAWFPFGAGPRQCIGAGLAMLEGQLTLTLLSEAVQLELVPGQQIRPLPRISLKPDGPIWVRAHARHGSI